MRALSLLFLILLVVATMAFQNVVVIVDRAPPSPSFNLLAMGLYDDPLPQPPADGMPKKRTSQDDDFIEETSTRLFQFGEDGKEVNGLLPPLGRRLDKGIACYFECSDRLVRNLVQKTSCNVDDACWALEACRGDMTEAWTRISYARRMRLMNPTTTTSGNAEWDASAIEKRFQEIKQKRLKEDKQSEINFFQPGKSDENWLPRPNPRPIDDEPWFTG